MGAKLTILLTPFYAFDGPIAEMNSDSNNLPTFQAQFNKIWSNDTFTRKTCTKSNKYGTKVLEDGHTKRDDIWVNLRILLLNICQ